MKLCTLKPETMNLAHSKPKTSTSAPTRTAVMNFWMRDLLKNKSLYFDSANEFDTTAMGEQAADHFKVMTDEGSSDIEQQIFDWAVEFSTLHSPSIFL